MNRIWWPIAAALAGLLGCATLPEEQARRELTPTGKLRVAIGVGAEALRLAMFVSVQPR